MAYREAVVVIHGMGEQRPLDTLDNLADAMRSEAVRNGEVAPLISHPTSIGGSYEARRYIIRPRFPSAEGEAAATHGIPPGRIRRLVISGDLQTIPVGRHRLLDAESLAASTRTA